MLAATSTALAETESGSKVAQRELGITAWAYAPNALGYPWIGIRFRWWRVEFSYHLLLGAPGIAYKYDFREDKFFSPHLHLGYVPAQYINAGAGITLRMFKIFGTMAGIRLDHYALIEVRNKGISHMPFYTVGATFGF